MRLQIIFGEAPHEHEPTNNSQLTRRKPMNRNSRRRSAPVSAMRYRISKANTVRPSNRSTLAAKPLRTLPVSSRYPPTMRRYACTGRGEHLPNGDNLSSRFRSTAVQDEAMGALNRPQTGAGITDNCRGFARSSQLYRQMHDFSVGWAFGIANAISIAVVSKRRRRPHPTRGENP